jgi:hypothetical protein
MLKQPHDASQLVYEVMQQCWAFLPERRCTAEACCTRLRELQAEAVISNATSRVTTGDHGFISDMGNFHSDASSGADAVSSSTPTDLTYKNHSVAGVHVSPTQGSGAAYKSLSTHTSAANAYVDTTTGAIVADWMMLDNLKSCDTDAPPPAAVSNERQSWVMSSARPSEAYLMNAQPAERQSWGMMSSARPSEVGMQGWPQPAERQSWDMMSSARPSGIGMIPSPLAAYTTVNIAAATLRTPHAFTVSPWGC